MYLLKKGRIYLTVNLHNRPFTRFQFLGSGNSIACIQCERAFIPLGMTVYRRVALVEFVGTNTNEYNNRARYLPLGEMLANRSNAISQSIITKLILFLFQSLLLMCTLARNRAHCSNSLFVHFKRFDSWPVGRTRVYSMCERAGILLGMTMYRRVDLVELTTRSVK